MAWVGFRMSPPSPYDAQVSGMNWARPAAPAPDLAFGFQPLSASSCAASTEAGTPAVFAAAATAPPQPLGISSWLNALPLTLVQAACAGAVPPPTERTAISSRH